MYQINKYRLQLVCDSTVRIADKPTCNAASAAKVASVYLQGADREMCIVLLLSTKNEVVGINTVGTGTLNWCQVAPREVFKAAILGHAAAIILIHNHPSGDVEPSKEDHALTRTIKAGGELLQIPLLDHLIIGDGGKYYSFRDAGVL